MERSNTNNMLAILESHTLPDANEIGLEIAANLRRRRVEKDLTRDQLADKAGISVSNLTRFEQKGLISLSNLVQLAIAMGYLSEIRSIFSQPKYDTMEELLQIRKNATKKRAYRK